MVLDPRKRQKKIERRKAKQRSKNRSLAVTNRQDLPARLRRAASAPALHAGVAPTLWDEGMAAVLLSRELSGGSVAYAVFLVDAYCLGVKDVTYNIVPRGQYDEMIYEGLYLKRRLVEQSPEHVRKLVEDAVDYAQNVGLSPHPDYGKARAIFGDIDAGACREQFTFGYNGKPNFVAGPYDDTARCRHIINTLRFHCGPDGFHFLLPLSGDDISAGGLTLIRGADEFLDSIDDESGDDDSDFVNEA